MKTVIKFALGVAGMPEATISDIDKALPALARLVEAAKELEPIVTKAYPDLVAVLPVLKEVIEFIQKE